MTLPVKKNEQITKWAEGFPSNHFIVSVMEENKADSSTESRGDSETHSDIKCVPCESDGKQAYAVGFCSVCVEHLCKNCCHDHKRYKATRNHVILKDKEMPKSAGVFKRMTSLSMCSFHPDREVEFKCCYHGKFVCPLCLRDVHRYCSQIEDIKLRNDRKSPCSDVVAELKTVKDTAEELLAANKRNEPEVIAMAGVVESERQQILKNLKEMTSYFENDFKGDFIDYSKSELAERSANITACSNILSSINDDIELSEILKKYGSGVQASVFHDRLKSDLPETMAKLTEISNTLKNVNWREMNVCQFATEVVKVDTAIKAVKGDVEKLKEIISTKSTEGAAKRIPCPTNEQCEKEERQGQNLDNGARKDNKDNVSKKDIKNVNENSTLNEETHNSYRSKEPMVENGRENNGGGNTRRTRALSQSSSSSWTDIEGERSLLDSDLVKTGEYDIVLPIPDARHHCDSCFNGSVLLNDGSMVFIDKNKETLTLVDPSFVPRFAIELHGEPSDICIIGDDMVAVAIPRAICIYEITRDSGICLEMTEKFRTRGVITSLTRRYDGNMAILFSEFENQNPECIIQIRTPANRIVEEIQNFSFRGGDRVCFPTVLRSRGPDEYLMAVKNSLSAFDSDGDERWFFQKNFIGPIANIAFDSQNNIYISDPLNNKIHQIASYSYKRSRCIVRAIDQPCSILYNAINRTLVVGSIGDDCVHVYQFQ